MKRVLGTWTGWIICVIAASFAIRLWQNEAIDWEHNITLIIAGLIGILVGAGIRKVTKKDED